MSLLSFDDVARLRFSEAGNPQLQIDSWSTSARVIQIRGFCEDGTISYDHSTVAGRAKQTSIIDIPDFPVILIARTSTTDLRRTDVFMRISLLVSGFPVGQLCSGYITDPYGLSWPGGRNEDMEERVGGVYVFAGTDPAAGAELSQTVGSNVHAKLKALSATFVASGAAASRYPVLTLDDGTLVFYHSQVAPVITAGQTRYIDWLAGYNVAETAYDTAGRIRLALPTDLVLWEGFRIKSVTTGLDAGDNWGAPVLNYEMWTVE